MKIADTWRTTSPAGAAPGRPRRVRVVAAGRGGGGGAGRGRAAGDRAAGAADRPGRGDGRDHGRARGIAVAARWRRPPGAADGLPRRRTPGCRYRSWSGLPGAGRDRRRGGVEQAEPGAQLEALSGRAPARACPSAHSPPRIRLVVRIVEIPPGAPQTKPRSCNAGLLLAKGDLIVIYDAEDRPDPGQLRVVADQIVAAADLDVLDAQLGRQRRAELHHPPVRAGVLPALRAHPARPGPARAADPARRDQQPLPHQELRWAAGTWNAPEDPDGDGCTALGGRVEVADRHSGR